MSAVWLGGRKSISELLDPSTVVYNIPLLREQLQLSLNSLLEPSLSKWRIQNHILLYTCSLQAWVLFVFSNSVMTFKLSTEEPRTWAALGQGQWSLKSIRFTPVVCNLVPCKQNVVVLNACQWELNKDSYSVQITVIIVLELDYPLKNVVQNISDHAMEYSKNWTIPVKWAKNILQCILYFFYLYFFTFYHILDFSVGLTIISAN